ncbi:peptidoglycan-binding domain-containing protein [Nostoc sp.]|uniref:peptidoglycan-binding domain-containing protein n=1 Tax=Nostoc sp. TaxID=1180 RepID=UPI002FFA518A
MKSIKLQKSIFQITFVLSKVFLSTTLIAELIGVSLTSTAIAVTFPIQKPPILVATAYTDLSLPTLHPGDRGKSVKILQKILLDNSFLEAAAVRLGNPRGAIVDGVFGSITESAVRDLQKRYKVPVTGQVNPRTWEVLDMHENPYHSPLPWKL